MAVPVPQYQQLEKLLDFLYTALRADTKLRLWLCWDQGSPDPNQIVRTTVEHNPLEEQEGPEGSRELALIYETDLPLLAIWEHSSVTHRQGHRWGEKVQLRMLYLFQSHLGDADRSPQTWNQRISKDLWWRICRLLRAHVLTGWGTTGDLLTDGAIHKITPGRVTRLGSKVFEGIAAELEMIHLDPPFTDDQPEDFTKIDLEAHVGSTVPSTEGPIVEADIDPDPT